MTRRPITTQRSKWTHIGPWQHCQHYQRNVTDGKLRVLVGEEPIGWHLSISYQPPGRSSPRYPTWDEIADARDIFLPADLEFVMFLPKAGEYVAVHDTTFHLHQFPPTGAGQ